VSNTGEGVITNYTLNDKIPAVLNYKVMSLSGGNSELSKCGYPITRQISNNLLTGKVSNAYLQPGESCIFELTTQVSKTPAQGTYSNISCASLVNLEPNTKLANNCGSDTIQVINACPSLTVTPDFGDNPLNADFNCILSGGNTGYIQILSSNDVLLKNYNILNGSHIFDKVAYYYVECVSRQFTPQRCIRPVVVKELSECLDLQVKDPTNQIIPNPNNS